MSDAYTQFYTRIELTPAEHTWLEVGLQDIWDATWHPDDRRVYHPLVVAYQATEYGQLGYECMWQPKPEYLDIDEDITGGDLEFAETMLRAFTAAFPAHDPIVIEFANTTIPAVFGGFGGGVLVVYAGRSAWQNSNAMARELVRELRAQVSG